MIINTQAGTPSRQLAGQPWAPGGQYGEMLVSEQSPQYKNLVKQNRVFNLNTANVTALTAFTGGAAGTPLLGIFNPPNSGVDIVLLQSRLAIRTTGTTAGAMGFNFWYVNQGGTAVTGTQTFARSQYSGAATGSLAYCMVNTANTGALASNLLAPSFSLGNVTTTAGVNVGLLVEDHRGAIVLAPGTYLAWGCYVAAAAAAFDAGLTWAEEPV